MKRHPKPKPKPKAAKDPIAELQALKIEVAEVVVLMIWMTSN